MTPTLRRRWFRAVCALAGLALLWFSLSLGVAYRLTRRAQPPEPEPIPEAYADRWQALRLPTQDGEILGAWFIPGEPGHSAIVVLHGNGGSRTGCAAHGELFSARGHPCLLVTLRAHGDSTGAVNDFGYSARHDVVAAIEWLRQHQPEVPIVVMGQSLGAAAAVFAAPELEPDVAGYILEGLYADLPTAVRNRTRRYLPPVVDQVVYAGLMAASSLMLPEVDAISPLAVISHIPKRVRVLILAGADDTRAGCGEARQLWERIPQQGRLVIMPGAEHLQLWQTDPAAYESHLLQFAEGCDAEVGHALDSTLPES